MLMYMFQRRKGASWITKLRSVQFIGYKYGMKGYKIQNRVTKKTVYNRYVVFREVKEVPRQEVNPMEKDLEKIEFKLEGEEFDSIEEAKSEEEEPHTPFLRRSSQEIRQLERYSPPNFCSHFSMSITDDGPRNVKEAVN